MSILTCTGRRQIRQQAQMVVPYKYQISTQSIRPDWIPEFFFHFRPQERVGLSLLTHLGLPDELLKISEQPNYWVMRRCKTPLASVKAQKCKNAEPGSGGGAQIWHQTVFLARPVHFHSSPLSGSDDGLKLSLDLHRYPSSGQKDKM